MNIHLDERFPEHISTELQTRFNEKQNMSISYCREHLGAYDTTFAEYYLALLNIERELKDTNPEQHKYIIKQIEVFLRLIPSHLLKHELRTYHNKKNNNNGKPSGSLFSKGGAKDNSFKKYLKYKTKYLDLKNNF